MSKTKRNTIKAIVLLCIFIVFTILVKTVDMGSVRGVDVGFAWLNDTLTPEHNVFYETLSDVLGYVCILICAFFGFVGLIQWIKKKDILKVNHYILLLGVFYIVVIIFYYVFNNVHINYRPTGALEQSYPSSHTVLAICVALSALRFFKYNSDDKRFLICLKIIAYILCFALVMTRYLSGLHWTSDVIGSIILSNTLISFFDVAAEKVREYDEEQNEKQPVKKKK